MSDEAGLGFETGSGYILRRTMRLFGGGEATLSASGERGTYEGLAYSGGPLTLKDYDVPVVVDLRGMAAEQVVPNDYEHNEDEDIGHTSRVTIDATKGIDIAGKLDTETTHGDLICRAAKGEKAWEFSITASVHRMEEYKAGESVSVNGREFRGPVLVARETTLKRVAFVHRGADVGKTHMTIAATKGANMSFAGRVLSRIRAAGWDEDKHPRADDGKWTDGSGSDVEEIQLDPGDVTYERAEPEPVKPKASPAPKPLKRVLDSELEVGRKVKFVTTPMSDKSGREDTEDVEIVGVDYKRDRQNFRRAHTVRIRRADGREISTGPEHLRSSYGNYPAALAASVVRRFQGA